MLRNETAVRLYSAENTNEEYLFNGINSGLKNNHHKLYFYMNQLKKSGIDTVIMTVSPDRIKANSHRDIEGIISHASGSISESLRYAFEKKIDVTLIFPEIRKSLSFNPESCNYKKDYTNTQCFITTLFAVGDEKVPNVKNDSLFQSLEEMCSLSDEEIDERINKFIEKHSNGYILLYFNISKEDFIFDSKHVKKNGIQTIYNIVKFVISCYEKGVLFSTYFMENDGNYFGIENVNSINFGRDIHSKKILSSFF